MNSVSEDYRSSYVIDESYIRELLLEYYAGTWAEGVRESGANLNIGDEGGRSKRKKKKKVTVSALW
jgi:hypothetical protein